MDTETDRLMRLAAFSWLGDLRNLHGDVVPYADLHKGFPFRGTTVRVLGPQGIFIPRGERFPSPSPLRHPSPERNARTTT